MYVLPLTMSIDLTLFSALNQAGTDPFLDLLMVALSFLGLSYVMIFIGPLLWHWKRRELAIDVVVLIIITTLMTEGLKLLIMRERPFEVLADARTLQWGWLSTATGYSMPSGHAARAFAVTVFLSLTIWSRTIRSRLRLPAVALAAMIGISRIYLGLHWPSDVIAGAILGAFMAAIMCWIGDHDNAYTAARDKAVAWLGREQATNGL